MRRLILLIAALCLALPAAAQQAADPDADLTVARPAYRAGTGPRLMIDGGHHNFHTLDGRFAPFAAVVRNDGFVVEAGDGPLTAEALAGVKVLVISNALNGANVQEWRLPTPSAFTPEEIAVVKAWVEQGGGLLLIADHMPFAGAAQDLAAAFGFRFSNGFAQRNTPGRPDIFTREAGSLKADVVTEGRDPGEAISQVRTFTGSAFEAPARARPILVFPAGYRSREPDVAWEFSDQTPEHDIEGQLQGAVLTVGKGRVAVFGEAAMFTAQLAGPKRTPMGFNAPDAPRNRQLMLNIVHWLAGLLPAA
ncbi:MAG: hypothetical protein KF842_01720 [Caulobacter sp.]|nr:hypothetical protein [Caulobacter sp.]